MPSHTPLTAYATLKQARKTFHHHPPQIARRADRRRRTPPARNQASSGGKTRFQSPVLIFWAGDGTGRGPELGRRRKWLSLSTTFTRGTWSRTMAVASLRLIGGRYDLDELSTCPGRFNHRAEATCLSTPLAHFPYLVCLHPARLGSR